ncbi:MAG: DUF167 domain-containing protein [Pirellulales bacterium]
MKLALESVEDGIVLPVRVRAGAGRNAVSVGSDGTLRVGVTQVAERGKANRAVIALLSKQLSIRKSQIELQSGQTSPQKRFRITDVTPEAFRAAVERVISGQ